MPQQSPNFYNVALHCFDVVEPLIEANEWVDIKLKIKRKIEALDWTLPYDHPIIQSWGALEFQLVLWISSAEIYAH